MILELIWIKDTGMRVRLSVHSRRTPETGAQVGPLQGHVQLLVR